MVYPKLSTILRDQKYLVQIIDSHTAGEPTRVVINGGPDLGSGPLSDRLAELRNSYDHFRKGIVLEPRGSDIIVGALLTEPVQPGCATGVIFFNNVGYLGMCGHGVIGVVQTLAYLGRISPGEHEIETPVGTVRARLCKTGQITVTNVPVYRLHRGITLQVPGYSPVTGDVAWGGNWFFLTEVDDSLALEKVAELTAFTRAIRITLEQNGITGAGGELIDHIEVSGPAANADSRNFVLCPGDAYDRSPCGTGTSAKIACLQADGKLAEGEVWRQESILGTVFEATYAIDDGQIIPAITGKAFITAESTLIFDKNDPFCWGIA